LYSEGGRKHLEEHFTSLKNLIEILPRDHLKAFIQIGSSDEYGNAPAPQHEGLRESPISPYSIGKVAATHFLQMLHRTENFPATILRLFLLMLKKAADSSFMNGGPIFLVSSPTPGFSTLITSAPISANSKVQKGPAIIWVRSITFKQDSAELGI